MNIRKVHETLKNNSPKDRFYTHSFGKENCKDDSNWACQKSSNDSAIFDENKIKHN